MKNLFLSFFVVFLVCCSNEPSIQRTAPVISTEISSTNILCISEDAQGYMWFGTSKGLYRYNGTNYHQYTHSEEDSLSLLHNFVSCMLLDSKKRLWVGTAAGINLFSEQETFIKCGGIQPSIIRNIIEDSQGSIFAYANMGLYVYDENSKMFHKICDNLTTRNINNDFLLIDKHDYIWWVTNDMIKIFDAKKKEKTDSISVSPDTKFAYMDKERDELWLCNSQKLQLIDTRNRIKKPLPATLQEFIQKESPIVYSVFVLEKQHLLLSTHKGLYYYGRDDDKMHYQDDTDFSYEKPRFTVENFFQDSKQNLWYTTSKRGFQYSRIKQGIFNSLPHLADALKHKDISSIAQGRDGRIWFYAVPDKIYLYQFKENLLSTIKLDQTSDGTTLPSYQRLILEDKEGYIWIAYSEKTLLKCKLENNNLKIISQFPIPYINSILESKEDGALYFGQFDKLHSFTKIQGNAITEYPSDYFCVTAAASLKDGKTALGFLGPGLYYIENGQPVPSGLTKANLRFVLNKDIEFLPTAIYEDADECLWIGTVGNGLISYNRKTDAVSSVPDLRKENIYSIEEDDKGFLWLGTENGLAQYDKSSQHIKIYTQKDGVQSSLFNTNSSLRMSDGTLLFGGTEGLTVVNPDQEVVQDSIPILFEDLLVFNNLVIPTENGTINKRLVFLPEVNLNHEQTGFSISFTNLNYSGIETYSLQYMLEGVDKDWVNTPIGQSASYANVAPGNYTFKVRATSNDLNTILGESALQIKIHPAPWNSWCAYLLYLCIIASVLTIIAHAYLKTRKEHARAEKERQDKERELHINQMNMNFFANVSHEFRTPLTVISAPLAQLSDESHLPDHDRHLLQIINRSVSRMLQLVNQMMDFNKLEQDTLKLQVSYQDIIPCLKEQLEFFSLYAKEKDIQLTWRGLDDYFLTWADTDKVVKILNNLLGNAMKYSPSGSKVRLEMNTNSQQLQISVVDNGPGIPQEQRTKIFERYYRFENHQKGKFNWGTGIGLYYVRKLVQLHHGQIQVSDNPDGKGSCFSFYLPTASAAYSDSEKIKPAEKQSERYPLQETALSDVLLPETKEEKNNEAKPKLLIVDDDAEIIHYLKILLQEKYDVVCRFDADTAYNTIQEEERFDLIISDLMMPGTNGIQFCTQLKADEQYCHIPFIMITAKSNMENQIEGIKAGAIAYISKPFDPTYLKALICTLLTNRAKTQKQLVESTQTTQVEDDTLTAQDKAFMTKLYKLMEEELSNPDLDIARMTELLSVSRSKLYYKIKGLTGENPGTFFRHYKLNRAAEMLREGKSNISEISMLTGFNSAQYFSTCFKKQFGCSPTEYK